MGTLLSYSGIATKLRAMKSRLLTEKQLEEIVHLSSMQQVTAYLKRLPAFGDCLAGVDEKAPHREELERLLKRTILDDYSRIYHFADRDQRKFLSLYAKRYEIRILKELMANLFDHRTTDPLDVSTYQNFFQQHSQLDLDRLIEADTPEKFLKALEGSEYHAPLSRVQSSADATLFDDTMTLDLYYFSQLWNQRKKLFRGKDLEELTTIYGEEFDMLNLQFIYRSRKYYDLRPAEIYTLLIPVHYHLSKEEIIGIVEAKDMEEARKLFERTRYGKRCEKQKPLNLEAFYSRTMNEMLDRIARENPYSIAILYSFLYRKEQEINRLTTAIESVRYGADPETTMKYIRNS